jgi:hypothetical protein
MTKVMTVKVRTGKMEKIRIREKAKNPEARTLTLQVLISPSFSLYRTPKSYIISEVTNSDFEHVKWSSFLVELP